MAFSFFQDPFQFDPFQSVQQKQPQADPFQAMLGSTPPAGGQSSSYSAPFSLSAPNPAATYNTAPPAADALPTGNTLEPKAPLAGGTPPAEGTPPQGTGTPAPPANQTVFGGLYSNIQDPQGTVGKILMSMGINPRGGDPRIQSLMAHANQLMAPIYAGLASGSVSLDTLEAQIRNQVQNALHGGQAFYSPYQGQQAISGLMQNLWDYNNATTGAGDPNTLLNPALAQMYSMFTGNPNQSDPMQLLNSFMMGGLDPAVQNTIQTQYNQLPDFYENWVAQHPQSTPAMSWLDFFLNPNYQQLPSTSFVNGAYY